MHKFELYELSYNQLLPKQKLADLIRPLTVSSHHNKLQQPWLQLKSNRIWHQGCYGTNFSKPPRPHTQNNSIKVSQIPPLPSPPPLAKLFKIWLAQLELSINSRCSQQPVLNVTGSGMVSRMGDGPGHDTPFILCVDTSSAGQLPLVVLSCFHHQSPVLILS